MRIRALFLGSRLFDVAGIVTTALVMTSCAAPQPPAPHDGAPIPQSVRKAWNPLIASDPGGRVYISFYGSGGAQGGLYVTRSLDGGVTWLSEPMNLETPQPRGKRIGFHKLETDGKGSVYVTWSIERQVEGGRWRTVEVRRRHSSDFGTTWTGDLITWIPTTGAINYPTPWTGPDGAMRMIWKGQEKDAPGLFFSRTSQGGATWLPAPIRIDGPQSEPVPAQSKEPAFSPPEWPDVSRDQDGRLFVAWQQGRGNPLNIYFSQSLDSGATWLRPGIQVDTSQAESSISRIPHIATDGRGGVYVVWEDMRHKQIAIHFNRSVDLGATWLNEDIWLTSNRPEGVNAWAPRITSDRQGRVYVVWHEGVGSFDTIYFTSSPDRGITWLHRPRQLDHHGPDARSESPRLANDDDGHVYVAWGETGQTMESTLFNRSSDAGETWLARPLRLNSGGTKTQARIPQMSVDGRGTIYVVWSSDRNGKLDLFLNRSTDHGATWLPQELQVTR